MGRTHEQVIFLFSTLAALGAAESSMLNTIKRNCFEGLQSDNN